MNRASQQRNGIIFIASQRKVVTGDRWRCWRRYKFDTNASEVIYCVLSVLFLSLRRWAVSVQRCSVVSPVQCATVPAVCVCCCSLALQVPPPTSPPRSPPQCQRWLPTKHSDQQQHSTGRAEQSARRQHTE